MAQIILPANGWKPRKYQRKAWDACQRGVRRMSLIWHRRSGKDEIGLHRFACEAMVRPANYWLALPTYEQSRKAIWEAVNPHTSKRRIDEAFPMEIRARTDNSAMTIEFRTGSTFRMVGSDNPDSLVGAGPAGVVFSEYAIQDPQGWGLIQPMLAENGGWAMFVTTPRGKNHAYGVHQNYLRKMESDPDNFYAELLTVDDTNAMSKEAVEEARQEYESSHGAQAAESLVQQEYYCSFEAAILGAYYGKEMAQASKDGRIGYFDPDPLYPMHTAWDLGVSKTADTMVIWFWQITPSGPLILGCYANHGFGIGHYAQIIKEYAERLGVERGEDWVPHDARQLEMGSWNSDPLSSEFGKAKQRLEVMIECGLNPRKVPDHNVADGISAVRQLFPRMRFDEEGCGKKALDGIREYCVEYDERNKIFRPTPKKNWAAHFADGLRYLAMAYQEMLPQVKDHAPTGAVVGSRKSLKMLMPGGWREPTFNDLLEMTDRRSKSNEDRI